MAGEHSIGGGFATVGEDSMLVAGEDRSMFVVGEDGSMLVVKEGGSRTVAREDDSRLVAGEDGSAVAHESLQSFALVVSARYLFCLRFQSRLPPLVPFCSSWAPL